MAENVNIECAVRLMTQNKNLSDKNAELKGTQSKLQKEVSTFTSEVAELKSKCIAAQELEAKHTAELEKALSSGKSKADDLMVLQVRVADAMSEKQALETKVKDLKEDLTNARNALWNTDELLRLTRSQLEVSEQSLKVVLERGMQRTKTTSMASATTATSKDESTQELSQAKNIIDAQRAGEFFAHSGADSPQGGTGKCESPSGYSQGNYSFPCPTNRASAAVARCTPRHSGNRGRGHRCSSRAGSVSFLVQRRCK